jgi:cyclohexa-1,5-dienecarbonyl-CoA hydratase
MVLSRPDTKFIKVEERDDVLYVTLDRPPLNVLTIAMMWELIGVFDDVAAHQGALRAVVLRGAGKAFSAGVDIGEHQGETLRRMLDSFHTLMMRVLHSPLPTIAVVHGYALGGGCELATVSDLVLIAEDTKIGVPEIKLAVFPPAAAVLFPRLIGTHRSLEMILTGEPISGAEAARIGLANRAVPADELDAALESILARLRGSSGAALRIAKRAVLGTLDEKVDHALDHLKWVQEEELIPSHDAQEGLKAFLEKRAPVWQHR